MTTKRAVAGARKARAPKRASAPPAVVDKYATLTVYDPVAKVARDAAGNVVTQRAPTLAELSVMPGALAVLDRAYVCEPADDKTIATLAKLANETVASLEARRRDHLTPPQDCPAVTPENRRRCWRCPRWTEADALAF